MSNESSGAPRSVPVVGIGASAGGIEALQKFFQAVPPDLGLAYVVVLHLAPDHKSELPAILGRQTRMSVSQVGDRHEVALDQGHEPETHAGETWTWMRRRSCAAK